MAYYFIALFTAYITSYATGHLLLSPVKNDASSPKMAWLFFKLLTGFVINTVVFACTKTNFTTVYITIFPLLFIGLLYLKNTNALRLDKKTIYSNLRNIEFKELIAITGILAIIFFLQYNKLFNLAGDMLHLHVDTAFNAQVGTFINQSGKETFWLDITNQGNNTPIFYHYFEIWFSLLFSNIFSLNILNALVLVSYSFMLTLTIVGGAAILQQYFGISLYKSLLFSIPLLFIGHFRTIFGEGGFIDSPGYVLFRSSVQKLGIVYISLLLFLLFINKKNLFARVFPFGLMFSLYGTTFPAAFCGGILYLAYIFFSKPVESRKELLFSSLTLIVPAAGIVLFYYLAAFSHQTPILQQLNTNIAISNSKDTWSWMDYLTNVLIHFFKRIFYYLIILLIPLLISTYFIIKKKIRLQQIRDDYGIFLFIVLTGLFGFCLIYKQADSFQLFTNIIFPVTSFFYFFTAIMLFLSGSLLRRTISVLIICLHFYYNFSFHETQPIDRNYYNKIVEMTKGGKNKYAYIFDNTALDKYVVCNANVIYANYDITRFTNDYLPVFLNSFDLLNDDYRENSLLLRKSTIQSPFYLYVMKKKEAGIKKTIPEYQVDFIRENNIQFLITNKNSLWLKQSPFKVKQIVESGKESFWFVEIYNPNNK